MKDPRVRSKSGFARTDNDGLDRRLIRRIPAGSPIMVEDDTTTRRRLAELGLDTPTFAVLPRNFAVAASADDFVFEKMTPVIQALARQVGLAITVPGPAAYRSIHEKDAEIIAPVLQFAHQFIVEGGATLTVLFLEHLGRHIAKRWGPKATRERDAVLEVVVTKGSRSKRLTYRGPVTGLAMIVEAAEKAFDDR